ncbi:glycosyltransferase family 4 protein [Streptomyces coacervatus]|uniref:Glycosyltransferase family 4 protein n=2 Tax=Streptomyces coacervatus TaxID=647381 RepID=A0ABP7I792_9ACTN|nr:glycosyltransferase [Streptomyces coacervatus]MDF2266075.1 glycosyltransferase [Streptomyces coacervatus]
MPQHASRPVSGRETFPRRVGDCDLLVEVCNGMPYLAPLWHKGPTMYLVNRVHTDLWDMRHPRPVAGLGRRLERWAPAGTHRAGPPLPKASEPLFVAVGRLVEYKRIDLLLRLWERVRPVTGGRLVVVGDGPERHRLTAMAGPGVEFTGRVSEAEKHRLLCEAWQLLHPSMMEGWGLVVTEAGTRATRAVGFDIPGLRDSVVDGVTGVPAGGESSFAAAWCSLALSRQRRSVMGRAAEARAEQFRWSSTVRQFREVAAEACGPVRPAPAALSIRAVPPQRRVSGHG